MSSNYNRFNLDECRSSYDEFLKIINLIYVYDVALDRTEKTQILKQYKLLSEKLNYPYFSKELLIDYFK